MTDEKDWDVVGVERIRWLGRQGFGELWVRRQEKIESGGEGAG